MWTWLKLHNFPAQLFLGKPNGQNMAEPTKSSQPMDQPNVQRSAASQLDRLPVMIRAFLSGVRKNIKRKPRPARPATRFSPKILKQSSNFEPPVFPPRAPEGRGHGLLFESFSGRGQRCDLAEGCTLNRTDARYTTPHFTHRNVVLVMQGI